MRIRIVQKPARDSIDGIRLDRFEPGVRYEVGTTLGALLLAEGWAEPVPDDVPPAVLPLKRRLPVPRIDPDNPPNLRRESYPPLFDRIDLDLAADLERRRRRIAWGVAKARNAERAAPKPKRRRRR